MSSRDELIASFSRSMPTRVAEATELWLAVEQGNPQSLSVLRRLLHTVKGEAHMLELETCGQLAELAESVVDALRRAGTATPLAGDALLSAFEGIGMVSGERELEDASVLEPLYAQLRAAIVELDTVAATAPAAQSSKAEGALVADKRRSVSPGKPEKGAEAVLRAEDVRPLVYEMRRLYGEQTVFHERLREMQRMLRALLVEIDPRQSPVGLAERIAKTLGYGVEVDRGLSAIRAEWSSNDFSLGLTLDELERAVHRASVVGTDRLLNQVVRVGRSTARTLGKEVELRVSGDAILDMAIERRLEQALLHLMRNALDHGIEPVDVRRAAGKPERAAIEVSISQVGATITVKVSDDGGGVDYDRLRQVLLGRGRPVEGLRNEELLPFLFEQGVTTAEQVTQISGRGVGLDVVAREITAAGGQIRIESTRGVGTRIYLNLPVTLRGEVAIPIMSGEQRYAVPCRAVHSVIRLTEIEQTGDGDFIRIDTDRGTELIRLYALPALLGENEQPKLGEAALILYSASGLYAVSIEGYENPRAITVQRAEEMPVRSPLIRGVSPTPDGGVLLLLDVEALHATVRGVARGVRVRQQTALVVEDAPVARELLCGILRSLGLSVREATDGRQGLNMACSEPPDIILTDIEMPYMDGIEMVGQMRTEPELSRVPVIVLTTVATDLNRSKLEQLGVVAVLAKQQFDELELKNLIERCVTPRV